MAISSWTGAARVAAAVYLLILLAGAGLLAWSARQERQVAVSVLGSGSRLSVLVAAGAARVLIVGGDDASAFANALAAARPFFSRRIDVLILTGDGGDLPAVSRAVGDLPARRVFALDGPLRAHLGALGLTTDQLIDRPLRINLPRSVVVAFDPGMGSNDTPQGWTATVEQAGTRLVFVSGDAPAPVDASAIVLGGQYNRAAMHGHSAPVVVVSAGAALANELHNDLAAAVPTPIWVLRVHEGEVAQLRFVDGGLALPSTARRLDPPASPVANTSASVTGSPVQTPVL